MRRVWFVALAVAWLTAPVLAQQIREPYPLHEGEHWTYRVNDGVGTYQLTRKLESVTHNNDSSEDYRFVNSTPDQTWKEWFTYYEVKFFRTGVNWPAQNRWLFYEPGWPQLQRPLKVGDRSIYEGQLKEGETIKTVLEMTKAAAIETVKVPAGEFRAMRVELTQAIGDQLLRKTEWYADGVGIVKSVVDDGQHLIVTELLEYEIP